MNTGEGLAAWAVAASLTFAGSVHCLGMCGGFVVALSVAGRRRSAWPLLGHHLLLNLGKATSYAFLGALAGALGGEIAHSPAMSWGARALGIVAALTLAASGLTLLGLRATRPVRWAEPLTALFARVTGALFEARPAGFPLVIGMLMGFLPCPLVFAGLAAAAASGSAASGAGILAGVALGTLPALSLVALSGTAASLPRRQTLARAAGLLLLVAAAFTLARGFGMLAHQHGHSVPAARGPGSSDAGATHPAMHQPHQH